MKNRKMKVRLPGEPGESRYAKKQRLKLGRGVVDTRWMSWFEDPENPRKRGTVQL